MVGEEKKWDAPKVVRLFMTFIGSGACMTQWPDFAKSRNLKAAVEEKKEGIEAGRFWSKFGKHTQMLARWSSISLNLARFLDLPRSSSIYVAGILTGLQLDKICIRCHRYQANIHTILNPHIPLLFLHSTFIVILACNHIGNKSNFPCLSNKKTAVLTMHSSTKFSGSNSILEMPTIL
jgi:hypothetical protein